MDLYWNIYSIEFENDGEVMGKMGPWATWE